MGCPYIKHKKAMKTSSYPTRHMHTYIVTAESNQFPIIAGAANPQSSKGPMRHNNLGPIENAKIPCFFPSSVINMMKSQTELSTVSCDTSS